MTDDALESQLAKRLTTDTPESLESWDFARALLPIYDLVRALFGRKRLQTCLKLMLLYELTRVRGRFDKSRIRSAMPYLDDEHVDRLVDQLYEGGWLELRAVDQTYTLSSRGMQLLGVLHAADFEHLAPDNVLARAAQNAAFGAKLDGAEETTGYLLDQLLGELERQVDRAQNVLQGGRPYRLIEWSRRNHRRQLEIIRGVLNTLESELEGGTDEFRRVVEIHERMQSIVRLQTGINDRLREWNVEQLYTSDQGYSVPQLVEAVLGMDESDLEAVLEEDIAQVPRRPPTLTTPEIRARFHATRRSLPTQREEFSYGEPETPETTSWPSSSIDMVDRLRATLTEQLEGRTPDDPPLEIDDWMTAEDLPGAAFELAMLSRLEADDGIIRLDDGRTARVEVPVDLPRDLGPGELIDRLRREGVLRRREGGWLCDLRVGLIGSG